jgi:lipopolysaccharide/colanic/teichoic acid biosynthesis glycosyltransferase
MRRRVELDIWYARHASLALDLKIMLRTPFELIRPRNAC